MEGSAQVEVTALPDHGEPVDDDHFDREPGRADRAGKVGDRGAGARRESSDQPGEGQRVDPDGQAELQRLEPHSGVGDLARVQEDAGGVQDHEDAHHGGEDEEGAVPVHRPEPGHRRPDPSGNGRRVREGSGRRGPPRLQDTTAFMAPLRVRTGSVDAFCSFVCGDWLGVMGESHHDAFTAIRLSVGLGVGASTLLRSLLRSPVRTRRARMTSHSANTSSPMKVKVATSVH